MLKQSLIALLVFSLFAWTGNVLLANEKPDKERISDLEKTLKEMQKELNELKSQKGSGESKSTTPPATTSKIEMGYKSGDGFFVKSKDGNYQVNQRGAILIGLGVFENNTTDDNGIFPSSVRLDWELIFFKKFIGRIELEFAGNTGLNRFQGPGTNGWGFALNDAYVEYRALPILGFRIGNFHVPFTVEGQYDAEGSMAIWSEPFIANWSHGRDPGIMLFGSMADMFDYSASIHNGEGSASIDGDDDFLMAASARIYFMKKSKNPNTFIHIGFIRSRDESSNGGGNVNSATLTTPWGRQTFDPTGSNEVTQGWKTGIDVGFRFDKKMGGNTIRMEGEVMYMVFERDFTARRSDLEGYGAWLGVSFLRNIFPKSPDSGVYGLLKFSYNDIDDRDASNAVSRIAGQRMGVLTVGAGYVFNKHAALHFNWVFVRSTERSTYGGPKASTTSPSDALEMAWFVRFDITW